MAIIKTPRKPVIHGFPKEYAISHGANEAIVLKFLARKTRKSKNVRDGKAWFYDSLTKIRGRLPYLSRSAVDRAIATLANAKLVEVANYNKRKFDKTRWYHVPQPHCDAAEKTIISFDQAQAETYGILCAVLLYNLWYWLCHPKWKVRRPSQEMSPKKLHNAMSFFSVSAIKRALKELEAAGMIIRTDLRKPFYTLPNN